MIILTITITIILFLLPLTTTNNHTDDFKLMYGLSDLIAASLGITIQAVLARKMLSERYELQQHAKLINRVANRKASFRYVYVLVLVLL